MTLKPLSGNKHQILNYLRIALGVELEQASLKVILGC